MRMRSGISLGPPHLQTSKHIKHRFLLSEWVRWLLIGPIVWYVFYSGLLMHTTRFTIRLMGLCLSREVYVFDAFACVHHCCPPWVGCTMAIYVSDVVHPMSHTPTSVM
jgi:hypothetical protein